MNKLNYAFTMLTAAGGAAALSPAAHAVTLYGSFTNIQAGYAETFQLQSDGGVADAQADYTDFTLTNDSLGNTLAIVGDNTTGFKASIGGGDFGDSYFGTGAASSSIDEGQTFDSFKPPFYYAPQSPGVLQPGIYYSDLPPFSSSDAARSSKTEDSLGALSGSIVVLSTGAVPEPEAWALLIAGAGMVGAARRASRKRALVQA